MTASGGKCEFAASAKRLCQFAKSGHLCDGNPLRDAALLYDIFEPNSHMRRGFASNYCDTQIPVFAQGELPLQNGWFLRQLPCATGQHFHVHVECLCRQLQSLNCGQVRENRRAKVFVGHTHLDREDGSLDRI